MYLFICMPKFLKSISLIFLLLTSSLWADSSDSVSASVPSQQDSSSAVDSTASLKAAWIKLEGDVDPGMNDYVRRAIAEARSHNPDMIVFEINTFGGRLDAAFDIVDTITAIHDVATVALVRQKAISAGALIALACNRLYMMPSTTIGDCAPILQSQEGPQILGEKIQSPLRAKFRNLAQRNGYPEILSEAMVTPELEVLELSNADTVLYMESTEFESLTDAQKESWTSRRTIVRNGELLTLTNEEADSLGFSQATVKDAEALRSVLEITTTIDIDISWAESLARFISAISGILLIIGFGALYMEFKTPGFGIFGIVGIVALSILFAGQYVSHLHDKLPLVLLLLGIALLFVEIFIVPGTFLSGFAGVALMVTALVLTFQTAEIPSFVPDAPVDAAWGRALVYVLICAVAALVIPVLGTRFLLPLLPEGMTPIMKADLANAVAPIPAENAKVKPGDVGVAHTTLRPSGKATFGDTTLDVQSRTEFLEAGTKVSVESVESGKIWVVRS